MDAPKTEAQWNAAIETAIQAQGIAGNEQRLWLAETLRKVDTVAGEAATRVAAIQPIVASTAAKADSTEKGLANLATTVGGLVATVTTAFVAGVLIVVYTMGKSSSGQDYGQGQGQLFDGTPKL